MTTKEADSTTDLLVRLRRIEGQVRGIASMIEEDRYCIDVLTQVIAVRKGLERVSTTLLDGHMRTCVTDAVQAGGKQADEKLDEVSAAIERLMKS